MTYEQLIALTISAWDAIQTLGIGGVGWIIALVLYRKLGRAEGRVFELQDEQRREARERARDLETRLLDIQQSKSLRS